MKVFKFGGASISSIERIHNLKEILSGYPNEKILVVISAMGKVTNALERVVEAFYKKEKQNALDLFQEIKEEHLIVLKHLMDSNSETAEFDLSNIFTEIEWLLHDEPVRDFNYYYDQVVCCGELLSTLIVSAYLNQENATNSWVDVRDVVRTDDTFRDAAVDWEFTTHQLNDKVLPLFKEKRLVITQGFIGSTDENESTTLGREGSDYTAAVFASILNASHVTIWKDVKGVMNADPKDFTDAVILPALSYKEVIEMAYYGAQVIHPKTIKPLQNKKIPLHVKCFLDPHLAGTVISSLPDNFLPPIIVYKHNQVLFTIQSKDYSFVEGEPVNTLHRILAEIKIKPNLSQNTAITLMFIADHREEKTDNAAQQLEKIFEVMIEKDLTLLTIRHYNGSFISKLTENKKVILEQKTLDTIQMVIRNN